MLPLPDLPDRGIARTIQDHYRYKELSSLHSPRTPNSFRLLQLWPGKRRHPLAASLQEYPLRSTSARSYICLSYRWQSMENYGHIVIDGMLLPISRDLRTALLVLRHPTQVVYLWIDAICINQRSVSERSHQVGLMDQIYSGAEQVNVWLGEADANSDALFSWAAEAGSHTSSMPDRAVHSLMSLAKRDYWSRAWIVQECIMAHRLVIFCGESSIDWSALSRCVSSLMLPPDSTHYVLDLNERRNLHFWWMLVLVRDQVQNGKYRSFGMDRADYATPAKPQMDTIGMPFLSLLNQFSAFECSVSLDKIYAFVPLARLVCASAPAPAPPGKSGLTRPSKNTSGRGCQHFSPNDHQAIQPDYRLKFYQAAYLLAAAQSQRLDMQLYAWHIISTIFKDHLKPFDTDEQTPEDSSADHVHAAREFFRQAFPLACQVQRKEAPEPRLFVQRLVILFAKCFRRCSLEAAVLAVCGHHSANYKEDEHVFGKLEDPYRSLLGRDGDFVSRIKLWVAVLGPATMDRSGSSQLDFKYMPFWRWEGQPTFDLPPDTSPASELGKYPAMHLDFLRALWGCSEWPREAWLLALHRGFKIMKFFEQAV